MLEKIYIDEPRHTDLNMYRCGIEDCEGGHSWGPAIRDHYIIHYVLQGRGSFQVSGKAYNLERNDGFLICPETIVHYRADMSDPWSYAWVGFHGLEAENYLEQAGLTPDNPVFRYERDTFLSDCLKRMVESKDLKKGREARLLGLLYEFLSRLMETADSSGSIEKSGRQEEYVRKAIEFIRMNFSRNITIAEIARHVSLDRSYLYSLFEEHLKTSPQNFLIRFRIEKACEFMGNKDLSIGDISRSVGYEDQLLFSKTFRKVKGIPPREYRKGVTSL